MEQWMDFPWLETFIMSTTLVGTLSGLALLLSKSPSGRWLGFALIACQVFILLKVAELHLYLPSAFTLITIASYLYFQAFFFQKRRISKHHFITPILLWILNYFLASQSLLLWIAGSSVSCIYIYLIAKLLVAESRTRGFSYFVNPGVRIAWLRNFVALMGLFLLSLPIANAPINLLVFLLLLGHVLFQLLQESAFLSPIPIGNKYQKSTLTPEIKAAIIDRLEDVMVEQHFYRQDDASLSKLAKLLGVTTHHLSQVLNESMKISFQDLLARFRVREACRVLRDRANAQIKIEEVANQVGYNSKSSFNTAFKKRTGLTPSEYRDSKYVRSYGEERLSERKTPSSIKGDFSLNHVFKIKTPRNMIRITFRNLLKHRLHSSLNIIGLTIGLSACLTIGAYVHYELSYDKHYPNAENIHRIALNRIYPNYNKEWAITAPILAPTLADKLPEVENYTRITWDNFMLGREGDRLGKQRVHFVDSGFFQVFQPPIIKSAISNELFKTGEALFLTETAAKKYFGTIEDPVGELFSIQIPGQDQKKTLRVAAVVADPEPNAHFSYEILVTMKLVNFPTFIMESWGTWAVYSYIKVHENVDLVSLRDKINRLAEENQGAGNDGFSSWLEAGNKYDYFLQPLTAIHLTSNLTEEFEANSSEIFVYFFALVGVFILLMAVVNFVNMATARASYRTLEVGIRKAVGAGRGDLMVQFLTESTILCLIAMILAVPLTHLFLPSFNQTIGKAITLAPFFTPLGLAVLVATPFALGLLSGFYPAVYLSHFGPAAIFQKLIIKRGKESLRHLLVLGQLLIAVLLIAGTITVFRQMSFLTNKPLGFAKDQLIEIENLPFTGDKVEVFRQEALKIDGVRNVSTTVFPLDNIRSGSTIRRSDDLEGWVNMTHFDIDENFLQTAGIQLIAGRLLRKDDGSDSSARQGSMNILLNETAVRQLGWEPEEAVNQTVAWSEDGKDSWVVVGVTEDFNFSSLHRPVTPFLISHLDFFPDEFRSATIRIEPRKMKEALASLEGLWAEMVPDEVFDFEYLDEVMAQYYEAERLTGKLFVIFSGLGIFICCLGLFGLMGYVVEQRAKEVGIRKVLGAGISQIILLLSKDYLRLVVISSALAIPIAWWGLDQWLEGFAYRVDNSIWTFFLAGFLVTLISWLTVAFYSYHAAKANPVNSLRSE